MRSAASAEEAQELYAAMNMTTPSPDQVPEHRELAESTHALHRELMLALRDARPTLADLLLAAWQADINMYAASARQGDLRRPPGRCPSPPLS